MEDTEQPAPPVEAGETSVDIHKPKPVHGWRELASEIGVITIGILIALAGEQIVEALHWREKVADAHIALRRELADNYQDAAERIAQTPCIDAQLDALKSRVLRSGATLDPAPEYDTPLGPAVLRHPSREWDSTTWQSVITEQVSSRLGGHERERYSSFYNDLALTHRLQDDEDMAVGSMATLASPLPLDASLRGHLVETIEAERARADLILNIVEQQMEISREIDPTISEALRDPVWLRNEHGPNTASKWCPARGFAFGTFPTS